jgi:glycyl-tRNA synthetase beta chain
VLERLRAHYVEGGAGFHASTEMFDAVLSNKPASPLDFDARMRALSDFLQLEDASSLAAANKRIANILRKANDAGTRVVKRDLLAAEAERRLHDAVIEARSEVGPLLERRSYTEALRRLARLRGTVDAFFDSVLVMDENAALRENRLALLGELRGLFLHTADLSRLPG